MIEMIKINLYISMEQYEKLLEIKEMHKISLSEQVRSSLRESL